MKNTIAPATLSIFLLFSVISVPANSNGINSSIQELSLSESSKKNIFIELVELQDSGMNKDDSEKIIKEKYGLTSNVLLDILMLGYEKGWLNEVDQLSTYQGN
jgi:hypothetical protein